MDINDIDKEIEGLNIPGVISKKHPSLNVKHADVKIILMRLVSVFLLLCVMGMGIYSVISTKASDGSANRFMITIAFVYVLIGCYVSYRLWKIDYMGWLLVFFISLAGIFLPLLSFITRGIMPGTIPIVIVSILLAAIMWWSRDIFNIKVFSDIFIHKV